MPKLAPEQIALSEALIALRGPPRCCGWLTPERLPDMGSAFLLKKRVHSVPVARSHRGAGDPTSQDDTEWHAQRGDLPSPWFQCARSSFATVTQADCHDGAPTHADYHASGGC